MKLDFEVQENFNMTGKIKDLNIEVLNVETFYKQEFDIENVNNQIGYLKDPFKANMNLTLKKGIKLPIPEKLQTDLGKSDLI